MRPGPIKTLIRENSFLHFKKWVDWEKSYLKRIYQKFLIPKLKKESNSFFNKLFELKAIDVAKIIHHSLHVKNPKFIYNLSLVAENQYINEEYKKAKKTLKVFKKEDNFYYWFRVKKEAQIIEKQRIHSLIKNREKVGNTYKVLVEGKSKKSNDFLASGVTLSILKKSCNMFCAST